jgi:hypothetical protein
MMKRLRKMQDEENKRTSHMKKLRKMQNEKSKEDAI